MEDDPNKDGKGMTNTLLGMPLNFLHHYSLQKRMSLFSSELHVIHKVTYLPVTLTEVKGQSAHMLQSWLKKLQSDP